MQAQRLLIGLDESVPMTTVFSAGAHSFVGNVFSVDIPGRLVGISYGRWGDDVGSHLCVLTDFTNTLSLAAQSQGPMANVGNAWQGYHHMFVHPYVRLVPGTLYILWLWARGGRLCSIPNGWAAAGQVRNHITMPQHNPAVSYNGVSQSAGPIVVSLSTFLGNLWPISPIFLAD